MSPQWKVNAGLRWDRYKTAASDPNDPEDFGGNDQQSFLSYQVGLIYKPLQNGTIYLMSSSASIPEDQSISAAQQDESYPTVAGAYAGTVDLKPVVTRTVELGTKWNLLDNRLLLSGAVFEEKQDHVAVNVAADVYAQIGEEKVKGVEVSANGSITENWNLIAGFSHLNATISNGGLYTETGAHVPNTPPNTFTAWST